MEELNLDLNNLFNLSYNFEGLKILLTSIAKNQELMMTKIKELEKNTKENNNKIESMISGEFSNRKEGKNDYNMLNDKDNITQNLSESNELNKKENIREYENEINVEEKKEERKEEEISINSKDYNEGDILLIKGLENRIFNLENEYKKLKSFIPIYDKSHTLNDILDEHKVSINDMNKNIKDINLNINGLKENIEQINIKMADFSIYDIFKDSNISGDIDAAKLLVKALEKKIFEKFKYEEEKLKKDEGDLLKLKNELTNLKNSSNFEARNLSYLKEQILKMPKDIEDIRTNLSDRIIKNKEYIDKNKEKASNNIKEINIKINNIRDEIQLLKENINNKIGEIENNIKKEIGESNPSTDRNGVKLEDFQNFKESILKKYNNLEKKYNALSSNNNFEELEEKINQLQKELQNKRPSQQEFYSLSELVQTHSDNLENLKNEKGDLEDSLKKLKDSLFLINKKCEDLILQNLRSNKNLEDSEEAKSRQHLLSKLDDYVETSIFNEFIREETKVNEKFKKDIDAYKQFNEEIIETLKKVASIEDLKNLEDYIVDMLDELKDKLFKLYPRKSDVNKNLKSLELQIKQIYEMIIKKDERTENWMLAKKPIGGFSCASCENYLGDLKESDEKVFWNQLPEHEKDINANRIGNGFSRILNLVNIQKENKNEKDDNFLLKSETEKPDYGKLLNKGNKDNEDNKKIDNEKVNMNVTGYNLNKRKKNYNRNVNLEGNQNTVPNMRVNEDMTTGFNTQRLRLTAIDSSNVFKELKDKKKENNPSLPPIPLKNDEHIDIYEEGKEQINGPKLIKIIKKKK